MIITIIGTGFVGVVSTAVFASFGNTVYGLDIAEEKIKRLKKCEMPFYEPGLEDLVRKWMGKGNIHFTTSYKEAVSESDVVILAVGTPSAKDGQADLSYVFASAQSLAPFLKKNAVVAIKSTVPPGTNAKVRSIIEKHTHVPFFMASLPEFLREGTAVEDTLHPDRILIGAEDALAINLLKKLHEPLRSQIVVMKSESAQMSKYAGNAYLATRITFINQISNLCEVNGADVLEVIKGIGFDRRIGKHYWYPGLGYGGSCFPKDVKELAAYARAVNQEDNLMVTINTLNEERIAHLMKNFETFVGGWGGKRIAVLGLSFKPNTNDMREAASTKIIPYLLSHTAVVSAYDPMAMDAARSMFPDWDISYTQDAYTCVTDADVVMSLVEWDELISLDIKKLAKRMKKNGYFLDFRNQYADRDAQMRAFGIQYRGIGRI